MPKFSLIVEGENLLVAITKREKFGEDVSWNLGGFYATRFIESENADEAIKQVFEMLKEELEDFAKFTENSKFALSEIREDEKAFDLNAPGKGFTFYLNESN